MPLGTTMDILTLALFGLLASVYAYLMMRAPRFALVVSLLIPVSYVVGYSTNTFFGEWKRWSVSIPVIYFAYVMYCNQARTRQDTFFAKYAPQFLMLIIFVNLILVIPAEILASSLYNKVNSLIILGAALLTPVKWCFDEKEQMYGFQAPFWTILYGSTIGFFFATNPIASQVVHSGLLILVLAFVFCFLQKKTIYWFAFRAHTLNFMVLARAHLPQIVLNESIVYEFPDWLLSLWMACSLMLLILTVFEYLPSTFLRRTSLSVVNESGCA